MSRERSRRLVAALDQAGLDALLVSESFNLRYLTGYTGSNGLAVIGGGAAVFVTDFRYVEQAAEEVDPAFEQVRAPQELLESLPDLLASDGPMRLGFDDAHTPVRDHARLRELLPERVEIVAAAGLVERLRRVKDDEEIEAIAAAQRLADEAFEALLARGLEGRTERRLALWLEAEMRERGALAPSFPSIVASGAHGALPHAQPREVELARGSLVVIDWGALLHGYCSDCTRTIAVGEPGDQAREVYELVLAAQRAGVEAVRAGAETREIDAGVRSLIAQGGHGDHFGHGLGHGVGLEIHEAPRLAPRSADTLLSGDVVTVEPGVYLPGIFGVRIEDLCVVTDDGASVLTGVEKELRVVD
jgi:Xaa-Pro aminopeptidase